jgi:ethanolaminephosphotransferase
MNYSLNKTAREPLEPLIHGDNQADRGIEEVRDSDEPIRDNQASYHDEDKQLLFKLTPYLTPQACANLHTYVYRGQDNALMAAYVTGPIARWITDKFIPDWIAPNCISTFAFVLSITPVVVLFFTQGTHLHNFEGQENLPALAYIMQIFMYPLYQILDCADGYQARKTKNTSPLGLLVDHGLDSYTCGFLIIFMHKMLQIGDTPYSLFLI